MEIEKIETGYRKSREDIIVTGTNGYFKDKKITVKGFTDEDLLDIKHMVHDSMKENA